MSSPGEWYNSLPPVSKAYGTLCLLTTAACQLKLVHYAHIALLYEQVFYQFQIWRLITNFFFLGPFSVNFGIRLLMIARYGVQLEKGPFDRRTADFLWMMIFGALSLLALSAIPLLRFPFLGISMVFMLLYVWSREFPNAQVNIYGLVALRAFYLPWALLALDVIFGSPLMPDLLGIVAGHLYYFLTVLHPLASGRNILKTPLWVYPASEHIPFHHCICLIFYCYMFRTVLLIAFIIMKYPFNQATQCFISCHGHRSSLNVIAFTFGYPTKSIVTIVSHRLITLCLGLGVHARIVLCARRVVLHSSHLFWVLESICQLLEEVYLFNHFFKIAQDCTDVLLIIQVEVMWWYFPGAALLKNNYFLWAYTSG